MTMGLHDTSTLTSPAHFAGLFVHRVAGKTGGLFGRRTTPRELYVARCALGAGCDQPYAALRV
jgi:hypothetical protein